MCHAGAHARDHARDATRQPHNFSDGARSKTVGDAFEARALTFLQRQRLHLVARNFVCRGGEIDLVMRETDGAPVFVEVRARAQSGYGGAAASVGWHKQQRIVRAAQRFCPRMVARCPSAASTSSRSSAGVWCGCAMLFAQTSVERADSTREYAKLADA